MSYNNGGYGQQGGYGGQQGGYGGQQGGYNQSGGYNQGQGYNQNHSGGEAQQYYGQGGQQGQQQYGNNQNQYQQSPPPYGQQPPNNQGYGGNFDNRDQGFDGPDGGSQDRGFMGAVAGGAAGAFGGHKIGGTGTTIVGALAGAFAGHKTQDGISDWRHDRKEKKEEEKRREEEEKRREEEEKRRQQNQHHGGHHGYNHHNEKPRGGNYAGGFTSTSRDIRLDAHGDFNLHAQCRRMDGSYQSSTISLNRYLENDRGSFRWSGGGGSGSSIVTVQSGDTLRAIAARNNCQFEELARHNGIQNADMIYPGQSLQIPGSGSGGCGGNFGSSARNVRLVDGGQRLEADLSRDGHWGSTSINLDERISNNNGCLQFV